MAIQRVRQRVLEGGHHIPDDIVIRRYKSGLSNFFKNFKDDADSWVFINNSNDELTLVAESDSKNVQILEKGVWQDLTENYG
ncbi:MAG: hypothetical protein RJQ09_00520 [Cyclobacteriaceae bacterium]